VVENVLKDDESSYKALNPSIDLILGGGNLCFISEVLVAGGDGGPSKIEIYTSNVVD